MNVISEMDGLRIGKGLDIQRSVSGFLLEKVTNIIDTFTTIDGRVKAGQDISLTELVKSIYH